tara:strand:+ start:1092 stop:2258 length:1167 start_codon:yes stop_codon:yes gene_type:complete
MRRLALVAVILLLTPLASAVPEATVELKIERKLANFDLGINGGELSPNGSKVLIYGEDGYAHLLSAESADDENTDIRLENETVQSLNSATWHPGGKSALIVGDSGTVLRFNSTNYALGEAEGAIAMADKDINAIQFTPGSSVAYLGTNDGEIWKYYADTFTLLDNTASSRITDIDCMRNENICVFTTLDDGIAVVDQGDRISWITNTKFHTWLGVGCEDPTMNACTAFASGKKTAPININVLDTTQSSIGEIIVLGQLQGDIIGDNPATESCSLIAMAPFAMVRWNQYDEEAFLMFSKDNASEVDVLLGGESYAFAWENSVNTGFIVTSQGRIVSFAPISEELGGGIPTIFIGLFAMTIPGVFLGLIYWNSPFLQRQYARLVGRNKKK